MLPVSGVTTDSEVREVAISRCEAAGGVPGVH